MTTLYGTRCHSVNRIARYSGSASFVIEAEELPPACAAQLSASSKIDLKDLELLVEFDFSGYRDPGVTHALPENCYPPEADETRRLAHVSLDGKTLPRSAYAELLDMIESRIEAHAIDYDCDCY